MENQDIKTKEQTAQTGRFDLLVTDLGNGHTNPISTCKVCNFGNAPEAPAQEPVKEPTFAERVRAAFSAEGQWPSITDDQEELEAQHNSLMDVIAASPLFEGEFVLRRLETGKVNGGTFGNGGRECSCLLGTMASASNIVKGTSYEDGSHLGEELYEKSVNHYAAQDLFSGIYVGDKPTNNLKARLAHQFITELLMSNRATLAREERRALKQLLKAVGRDRVPAEAE